MTRGYNDDFCISAPGEPVGTQGFRMSTHFMSKTVECHFELGDGQVVTKSYDVGTYSYWFLLLIAFGTPWAYVTAVAVALIRLGVRSLASR